MSEERAKTLRLVLGDQLSPDISSLADIDKGADVVLMAEVSGEATYVKHHKKKLAFVFSAMRHFAGELQAAGVTVDYVRLDDDGNTGALGDELARAAARYRPDSIVVTEPGEWRLKQAMSSWAETIDAPLEIRTDERFFCASDGFADWANGRKQLRMEDFYRRMRRKTGYLLRDDGSPEGGHWNYDKENRKSLPADAESATPMRFTPDETTIEVLKLVDARFGDHFGTLEPFRFAVTRGDARRALAHFVATALPRFGDYQDAMRADDPVLFHSMLSAYLNIGLLAPRELCDAAEQAYRASDVPLNAAEGFIRQILGWREFVRGLYWLRMPDYAESNFFGADRALPDFYWSGETDMRCLGQAIGQTRENAYAHHIQRLMVTGNFALLAGLDPKAVEEWYLLVYADAYEWVELPNVHGMALFADGGTLASKPYASGGNYINKMSDYCGDCRYSVSKKTGEEACPFNYLYWDFLARNEKKLKDNNRLAMPYRTLGKMSAERKKAIRRSARAFLEKLSG